MKNKTFKDIFKVAFSNLLKLFSGVLVGFLLPRIIGVTDYGYYKTFTLYSTYVGLFHFGFVDGIYLKYGGVQYEELEKSKFRLCTLVLIILEIFISFAIASISILFLSGELKFIFLCLSAYLLCNNITGYFQTISQITSRFKEYSFRVLIQSILISILVIVLWIISKCSEYNVNYKIFTIFYIIIMAILMGWYIWTYRDIIIGKREKFVSNRKMIVSFFLCGIPLLISNLCQTLIVTLDRQFVNILFDMNTYAVYAFAYNMLSLITTALAAISTVIYPVLKKSNESDLKSNYSKLITIILILVFSCLIIYFPLIWFVDWFLPKYYDSIIIFRIILPGIAISSAVSIIMHNYYKAFNKEVEFFIKSLIVMALAIGANLIAYYFFGTTISISIASIIVMLIWYIIVEDYFVRNFKVKHTKNILYMIILMIYFYLSSCVNSWIFGMIIYFIGFVLITLLFYFYEIKMFIKSKH